MSEIEGLMKNIHPEVREVVRQSLLQTFVNMVALHRNGEAELEEISRGAGSDFGSW